jgi:hypothetical protein
VQQSRSMAEKRRTRLPRNTKCPSTHLI